MADAGEGWHLYRWSGRRRRARQLGSVLCVGAVIVTILFHRYAGTGVFVLLGLVLAASWADREIRPTRTYRGGLLLPARSAHLLVVVPQLILTVGLATGVQQSLAGDVAGDGFGRLLVALVLAAVAVLVGIGLARSLFVMLAPGRGVLLDADGVSLRFGTKRVRVAWSELTGVRPHWRSASPTRGANLLTLTTRDGPSRTFDVELLAVDPQEALATIRRCLADPSLARP